MTRRRAPQRTTEETRHLLVAATRWLMASMPTSAITVRAIGEEAGLPFSLVNRHFGTKDALLQTALEQIMSEWIAAINDGPADQLVDRAVEYLAAHPFDVAGIRYVTVDESTFPDGRSPVADAIVARYAEAGRHVEAIDVTVALSLVLGWMSAEDHWITTAGLPADEARAIVKAHALRCLER